MPGAGAVHHIKSGIELLLRPHRSNRENWTGSKAGPRKTPARPSP